MIKAYTLLTTFNWILTYIIFYPITLFLGRSFYTEDIFSLKPGTIFVLNHASPIDSLLFFTRLPFKVFIKLLPIRMFVSKNKFSSSNKVPYVMYKLGIVRFLHIFYNSVYIPETGSTETKLSELVSSIQKKQSVLIFPEGNLNFSKVILPLKKGVFVLSKLSSAPLFVSVIVFRKHLFGKVIFGKTMPPPSEGTEEGVWLEELRSFMQKLINES
jgi:1-acyl-sn-glycerol-3-phosphate acyltransferase